MLWSCNLSVTHMDKVWRNRIDHSASAFFICLFCGKKVFQKHLNRLWRVSIFRGDTFEGRWSFVCRNGLAKRNDVFPQLLGNMYNINCGTNIGSILSSNILLLNTTSAHILLGWTNWRASGYSFRIFCLSLEAVAFIIAVVTVNCLQHFHGDNFTFTDDSIFDESLDRCKICFLHLFCWFRGLQLQILDRINHQCFF